MRRRRAWFAGATILLALVGVTACRSHSNHSVVRRRGVSTDRAPDPAARSVLRSLAREATRPLPAADVRRRGRPYVLSHVIDGGMWRLAFVRDRRLTCWLLLIPRVTRDGTCGPAATVGKQPILIYMAGKPDPARARSWTGFVAYGLVNATVRRLAISLSDCSSIRVDLTSRPLFWRFIPMRKLRQGATPDGFVAELEPGERIRGRLPPLRPGGRRSCARQP